MTQIREECTVANYCSLLYPTDVPTVHPCVNYVNYLISVYRLAFRRQCGTRARDTVPCQNAGQRKNLNSANEKPWRYTTPRSKREYRMPGRTCHERENFREVGTA